MKEYYVYIMASKRHIIRYRALFLVESILTGCEFGFTKVVNLTL